MLAPDAFLNGLLESICAPDEPAIELEVDIELLPGKEWLGPGWASHDQCPKATGNGQASV